jgi:hypothetical protein
VAITQQQISTCLTELQCRSNFNIKNLTEYMLPNSKEAFYLHIDSSIPQLIIRPAYEVFVADLSALEGVKHKEGYFHSAEMTRFPTRIFKSSKPIHYGLAFKFNDETAVKLFVNKLIKIISGN